MIKPTIGIPIIGLSGIWLLSKRKWAGLSGMGVTFGILMGAAFTVNPHWISAFLSVGDEMVSTTFGYHPTLWGLASLACGWEYPCNMLVGWLACLSVVGLGFVLALHPTSAKNPLLILGISAPIALLIPPYLWAYDYILLGAPILIVNGALIRRGMPFMLSAVFFLLIDICALILLYLATRLSFDILTALLALSLIVLMLVHRYQEN